MKMRLVLVLAVALLALLGGWSWKIHAAQAVTLFPCAAAPPEYIAAFDGRDGTIDGSVSYPEPRKFLESQGWLKPPGITEIHHFEHAHIAMCFPYAETWQQANGSQTVDVEYTFHNASNYTITKSTSQFVDGQNSGGGYVATTAQLAEIQQALDASLGTTTQVFQSYTMKPIGVNCRKTFKATLTTVRTNSSALVDEWFPADHWTTYVDYAGNTKTCTSPEFNTDQVRGRDWIKGGANGDGYIYATVFDPNKASQADAPVAMPWTLNVAASGGHVTAYVDPHFHQHPDDLGIWHQDYGDRGVETFPITIPTDTFPAGWHRLVYEVERADHASVMVVPFYVQSAGDTEAPTTPTNLRRTNNTPTSLILAWSASTDNVGVDGYRVYQDGTLAGTVTATQRNMTGLTSAPHTFGVEAFDAAGNASPKASVTLYPHPASPYWTTAP